MFCFVFLFFFLAHPEKKLFVKNLGANEKLIYLVDGIFKFALIDLQEGNKNRTMFFLKIGKDK